MSRLASALISGSPAAILHLKAVEGDAGTITAFYRDSTTRGHWVQLGTSPGSSGPVSLALQVWSGLALLNGPAEVTFSKFAITKGACV